MAFREHASRSLVKSITFRCIVIISDLLVIFAVTHRYEETIGIVILTNLSSTILYYLHERAWNRITWGRKASDSQPTK